MKKKSIEAIYRQAITLKPATGHQVYPYLLWHLVVTQANRVWAIDMSYIPMARGFVYPRGFVDWFSRRVLSSRLSITMETAFSIDAVEEALTLG